jgi:hypothetical protein
MTVVVYPAVVSHIDAARLSAHFVDFPDIGAEAESPVELIRLARERLGEELQRLENAGDIWPNASGMAGLEIPLGGSVILVDVSVEDTPVRLTISLGERLLKRIDEDAEARSMTRSGYLALGARKLLGDSVGGETGKKIQGEIEDLGRRLNEALGPNSTVGRTLAELDGLAVDGFRRLSDEVRAAIKKTRHVDEPVVEPEPDAPPAAAPVTPASVTPAPEAAPPPTLP